MLKRHPSIFGPGVSPHLCSINYSTSFFTKNNNNMSAINVPARAEVSPESQLIFDALNSKLGFVPNGYALIGHSANALSAYLDFQGKLSKGSFSNREIQAIFLAVSQANNCDYCLAAHTTIGKMNGFTEAETLQLRAGEHPDAKLRIITRLASNLVLTRGRADANLVQAFFDLGYGQKELVDLVALVADKLFMNLLNNLSLPAIDFPVAPVLEGEMAGA